MQLLNLVSGLGGHFRAQLKTDTFLRPPASISSGPSHAERSAQLVSLNTFHEIMN